MFFSRRCYTVYGLAIRNLPTSYVILVHLIFDLIVACYRHPSVRDVLDDV